MSQDSLTGSLQNKDTKNGMSKSSISPSYYNKKGQVSCYQCQKAICSDLDGLESAFMFTIIKYLYRFKKKNGVEDLRKALTYLEFLIGDSTPDDVYQQRGLDNEYELKYRKTDEAN